MRLPPDSPVRPFSPRRAVPDAPRRSRTPSALELSRPEPRCYSHEPDSDADDDSAGSAPWQPGPSTRQHAGQPSYGPSQRLPTLRSVNSRMDDDSDDSDDDIPFDPAHSVAQPTHHHVHQHDPHAHDETAGTRPSEESGPSQIAAHQSHYQHARHYSGGSTRSNYDDDSEESDEEMDIDHTEEGHGGREDLERRRSPPAHSRTHPQPASHQAHRREASGSVSLSAPAPARARPAIATSSSVPPVSPSISASSTGPPTPALPPSAPSPPVPQPPTPHVPPTFSFNPNRYPAYDHNNRRIGLEHLQYDAPPRQPRRGGYYRPQTRDYSKTFHHSASLPITRGSTRSDKGKGKEPTHDPDSCREEGEWEEDRATGKDSVGGGGGGGGFRSESPAVPTLRPVSPSSSAPPRPRGRGRTTSSSASPGAQSRGKLVSLGPPESADPATQLRQLVNIDPDNEDIEGIGLESLADPPPGEKPNYPLPTLIKLAIHGSEKKRLTLQEIYAALEDRFVWFKERTGDAAWKNSIRHNLSLRKCFVRVQRPITEPGKGSYWMIDLNQGEGNKRIRKRNKKPTKGQLAQQAYEESQRAFRLNPMPPVNTFPAPSRQREDDMQVDELEDDDDFDDSPPRTMSSSQTYPLSQAQHPQAGPSRLSNPPPIDESNIDPELRPASQSSGHVVGNSRRPSTLNTRQANRRSPYPSTSPTAPTPSTSQQSTRSRRPRTNLPPPPRLTLPQLPPPVLPHIPPSRPFNLPSPQMHNTASRLSQPLPPMRLAQTPPPAGPGSSGAGRSTSLSFGQPAFGRAAFGQSSLPAVGAGGLGRAILSAPDKRREEEEAERPPVRRFVRPPPRAGQVYVMEGGLLVAKYRKDVRSDEEIVEEPEEDEMSGSEGRDDE